MNNSTRSAPSSIWLAKHGTSDFNLSPSPPTEFLRKGDSRGAKRPAGDRSHTMYVQCLALGVICALAWGCAATRPIKYYRIEIPAPAAAAPTASAATPGITLQVAAIDCPPLMRD